VSGHPGRAEQALAACREAVAAVSGALASVEDRRAPGGRPGQYALDLVADAAACAVLHSHGLAVLSEESGLSGGGELMAVLDPVDGSTNASRRLPWHATSICVLDAAGPLAALVVNLATGTSYEAVRGGGARRDGSPIAPSATASAGTAVVALSGYPPRRLGWRQYRVLGASALDLCAVADGALDAFVDCSPSQPGLHGPWDYLGGLLVCREAGAVVADADGRELVVRDPASRRTPLAAGTATLLEEMLARRREALSPPGR